MKLTTELVGLKNTRHPANKTLRLENGVITWFSNRENAVDINDGYPVKTISRLKSNVYEEVLTVEQAKNLSSRALLLFNNKGSRLETEIIEGVPYPVIHVNNPRYVPIAKYVVKMLEFLRHKHYTYLDDGEVLNLEINDMSVLKQDVFNLCEDMINWRVSNSKYTKAPIHPRNVVNGYGLSEGDIGLGTVAIDMASGEIFYPTINLLLTEEVGGINKNSNLSPNTICHYDKSTVSLAVLFKKVGSHVQLLLDKEFKLSEQLKLRLTKELSGYLINEE